MFLTITNTNYEHLIPDDTMHQGQMWAEQYWDVPGGKCFSTDQKLKSGNSVILVISVFVNRYWDGIAYWMVEEGINKTPFFKTWQQIEEAINNGKLKII